MIDDVVLIDAEPLFLQAFDETDLVDEDEMTDLVAYFMGAAPSAN